VGVSRSRNSVRTIMAASRLRKNPSFDVGSS
jgi:hypothetical protein